MCCRSCRSLLLIAAMMAGVGSGWSDEPSRELGCLQDAREIRVALEQLDHAEREQLRRQSKTFAGLPDREKRRLRAFHAHLMATDDPERLYGLMKRYRDWLGSLSANERAEIMDLPMEDRVAAIKAKMVAMSSQPLPASELSPQDMRTFAKVLITFVQRHEKELKQRLPEATQRELQALQPPQRMWTLAQRVLEADPQTNVDTQPADNPRVPDRGVPDLLDTNAIVPRLMDSLSPSARDQLAAAVEADRERELFLSWLEAMRLRHFRMSRERLQQFFERELSPEERNRLEGLPPEEMKKQLQELFRQRFRERRRQYGRGRP